jgi:hypothetical protein
MTMDDITQRKNMAMGKGPMTGDFGVKSFKETMLDGKSMGSPNATTLSEKERCAPVGIGGGKMKAQAQPMHGNHGYDT